MHARERKMPTFTLDSLRDLLRHMEWADATVWSAVLCHPPSATDTRLRELLLHVHSVQRAFLHMWISRPVILPKPDSFPDIVSLQSWACSYYPELAVYLSDFDEANLTRPIVMPWLGEFEER